MWFRWTFKHVFMVGVVVSSAMLIALCLPKICGNGDTSGKNAYMTAKSFVGENFSKKGNIEHPWFDEEFLVSTEEIYIEETDTTENYFIISAYFDFTDRLGDKIKCNYKCKLKKSGKVWSLVSLDWLDAIKITDIPTWIKYSLKIANYAGIESAPVSRSCLFIVSSEEYKL